MPPTLILASNSPRRKQLMEIGGFAFEIQPADVDEIQRIGEPPEHYVRRLAETKARALSVPPAALVVAADTIVVDGSQVLGKPAGRMQATQMLKQLRNKTHQVMTALAVFSPLQDRLATDLCITNVPMRNYSDDEIAAYVASGDPLDKAGAYAIQHAGFHPVLQLEGCYPSVMGLPVCHLTRLLASFGVPPASGITAACKPGSSKPCQVFMTALRQSA
jgi:MAF protein